MIRNYYNDKKGPLNYSLLALTVNILSVTRKTHHEQARYLFQAALLKIQPMDTQTHANLHIFCFFFKETDNLTMFFWER